MEYLAWTWPEFFPPPSPSPSSPGLTEHVLGDTELSKIKRCYLGVQKGQCGHQTGDTLLEPMKRLYFWVQKGPAGHRTGDTLLEKRSAFSGYKKAPRGTGLETPSFKNKNRVFLRAERPRRAPGWRYIIFNPAGPIHKHVVMNLHCRFVSPWTNP